MKQKVEKNLPAKKQIKDVKKEEPMDDRCLLKTSARKKNGKITCQLDIIEGDGVEKLKQTTGCQFYVAGESIISKGLKAASSLMNNAEGIENESNYHLALMAELKPQDGFEGMLISQMTVTFQQALNMMSLAGRNYNSVDISGKLQNQGIKLMKLYNQQLETLDKHRRKGSQKMTVEHVHVHNGGQAIVGTVTQRGEGGDDKK